MQTITAIITFLRKKMWLIIFPDMYSLRMWKIVVATMAKLVTHGQVMSIPKDGWIFFTEYTKSNS